MAAEEINEGQVIEPHQRHVERDAAKWQIIETDGEEVTFKAGTEIFKCHKSGTIYREWEKEAKRRADGGKMEERFEGTIIRAGAEPVFEPIGKVVETRYESVVHMVDTQLEERQHRLAELRKKYNALDWGDPQKIVALEQMTSLEKKVLGDP